MREFCSELPSLIHHRGIDIEPVTLEVCFNLNLEHQNFNTLLHPTHFSHELTWISVSDCILSLFILILGIRLCIYDTKQDKDKFITSSYITPYVNS